MRIALGLLMLFHGIAHLVGVIVSWQLAPLEGAIYKTTILSGRVDIGDGGMRVMGALWLLSALTFGLASFGAFTSQFWWASAGGAVAIASLVLSLLAWPDSRIGVAINLVIMPRC